MSEQCHAEVKHKDGKYYQCKRIGIESKNGLCYQHYNKLIKDIDEIKELTKDWGLLDE